MTPAEKERLILLECEKENYRVQLNQLLPKISEITNTLESLRSNTTAPLNIQAISDNDLVSEVRRRMLMRFYDGEENDD